MVKTSFIGSGEKIHFYLHTNDLGQQSITVGNVNELELGAPDFSAALNIVSANSGISFPSMTDDEMNAIANPTPGLIVYNTDEEKTFVYTNKFGWFSISGIKLPTITVPNGIATWGSDLGHIINDTLVTIDDKGNMNFPTNAVVDLSDDGVLKANIIETYSVKCQTIVAEDNIDIHQLTSTKINADHATLNDLTVNKSLTTKNIASNTLQLQAMTIAERNNIINPSNGLMVVTTDNGGSLNICINGVWHIVATTIHEIK